MAPRGPSSMRHHHHHHRRHSSSARSPSSQDDDDDDDEKDVDEFSARKLSSNGGGARTRRGDVVVGVVGITTRNSAGAAAAPNDYTARTSAASGAAAAAAASLTARHYDDIAAPGNSDMPDDDDDIYAQLEQFEHSPDVELEDLEKLGILERDGPAKTKNVAAAAAAAGSGGNAACTTTSREGDDVVGNFDENNSSIDNNRDESSDESSACSGSSSERDGTMMTLMTLMPPPSAWFHLDEHDHYITKHDGNVEREDGRSLHPKGEDENSTPRRRSSKSDNNNLIDDASSSSSTSSSLLPEFNPPESCMFDPIPPPNYSALLEPLLRLSSQTLVHAMAVRTALPAMLRECSSSAVRRSVHGVRSEYARSGPGRYARASDIGNGCGGYYLPDNYFDGMSGGAAAGIGNENENGNGNGNEANERDASERSSATAKRSVALNNPASRDEHLDWMWAANGARVRFTTLPWIERQLVEEWRTYEWDALALRRTSSSSDHRSPEKQQQHDNTDNEEDEDEDDAFDDSSVYAQARTLAPRPLPKPQWENAPSCYACSRPFSPSLHRHHCRRCGHSHCNAHSDALHPLPHLGYDADVPERVCRRCKAVLDARDLEERVSWRLARCRDFVDVDDEGNGSNNLIPYFDTGVDTAEDVAFRLTRLAISLARSIPLGAQAYVAIETVEVLRKHGLKGVYGLLLRKEFLAAADLLCRVLGINRENWPLSVHELSAAIFYALAQHRALRGVRPEGEELIHSLMGVEEGDDDMVGGQSLDGRKVRRSRNAGQFCEKRASSLAVVQENPTEENDKIGNKAQVVDEGAGSGAIITNQSVEQVQDDEDDDEAGDTIVWEGSSDKKYLSTGEFLTSILDETDVYDPSSEKVVDVLAMSALTNSNNKSNHMSKPGKGSKQDSKAQPTKEKMAKANENDTIPEQHANNEPKLPFAPVCSHVPDSLISSLLLYAPLALDFIYAECEVDMQLLAAQQGWRLVYASLDQNHHHNNDDGTSSTNKGGLQGNERFSDKPASALFAHDEKKIACLSIRGTATIQDVVTDIRQMPIPFPQQEDDDEGDEQANDGELDGKHGNNQCNDDLNEEEWTSVFLRNKGLALCGMAGAATNLFRETADSLLYLALRGYRIRIVGHSLGGGVAALLGVLVMRHFERQQQRQQSSGGNFDIKEDGFVKVYGYGMPSCVDAKLADHPRTLGLVTSVVLHDDVVPRLTPTSVRGLLKHLLYIRETWVKTHLSDDLNAITERAYHVWPTRLRGSFTLLKKKSADSARRLKKSCRKRIKGQEKLLVKSSASDVSIDTSSNVSTKAYTTYEETSDADANSSDEGVDVEGDLFFDPLDDPLNESDDETSVRHGHNVSADDNEGCDIDWVPFDEPPLEPNDDHQPTKPADYQGSGKTLPPISDKNSQKQSRSDGDATPPQILEELPLPRMFIPGRIVHVYTHRGGYKAAFVPRKFRSLRRISMAGNMLSDHMAKSYYEGLLEVKAIRSAKQDLPHWVGFADDATCACCASLFTWASTSNTEAQAARDKHNCRACGGLVCEPCSKKRVPIPAIGITAPVRVCDRCYNGWGTLYGDVVDCVDEDEGASMEESVSCSVALPAYGQSAKKSNADKNVITPNSRRSAVVDELASRIPSITS